MLKHHSHMHISSVCLEVILLSWSDEDFVLFSCLFSCFSSFFLLRYNLHTVESAYLKMHGWMHMLKESHSAALWHRRPLPYVCRAPCFLLPGPSLWSCHNHLGAPVNLAWVTQLPTTPCRPQNPLSRPEQVISLTVLVLCPP